VLEFMFQCFILFSGAELLVTHCFLIMRFTVYYIVIIIETQLKLEWRKEIVIKLMKKQGCILLSNQPNNQS